MCCDEVNARIRPSAVMFIEVGAPSQSIGHFANAPLVAFPKTADRVTIFSIPFGIEDRKIANLIAPIADVPRLCDSLYLRERRVLLNHLEKRMKLVEPRVIARQGGSEIEPKSVHVHLQHPIPQTIGHQL